MGQVPCYGIIGNGRVARHFKHYFHQEGINFRAWARQSSDSAQISLGDADPILLLVSDGAIESVISYLPFLKNRHLIHFSGSHISEKAWGAHPLMTFSDSLYDVETYRRIPFVVEEPVDSFLRFFPQLKNQHFVMPKEKKSLYHALCVLSGNFTTILWDKTFKTFEEKLGLPREICFPYLERICDNLKNSGFPLTGPIVRHDAQTIRKNLSGLENDPYQQVYLSMVKAVWPEVPL